VDQAPPENPLRQIELAVESSGVPYTILRPPAFMQNFSEGLRWDESLVEGIRERDEIAHPGGDGVVSYVSTEDIAAVAATALTEDGHGDEAYAPMGPEPLTLTQVAEHISWVAGRRIRYVETNNKPLRDELIAAGVPPGKIVIGAAFYGRLFAVKDTADNGLYDKGSFYHGLSFSRFADSINTSTGFTQFWDPVAQAPYAFNAQRRLLFTYDDTLSVRLKTQYAWKKKLNGIMFWQLADDAFSDGLLDVIDRTRKTLNVKNTN